MQSCCLYAIHRLILITNDKQLCNINVSLAFVLDSLSFSLQHRNRAWTWGIKRLQISVSTSVCKLYIPYHLSPPLTKVCGRLCERNWHVPHGSAEVEEPSLRSLLHKISVNHSFHPYLGLLQLPEEASVFHISKILRRYMYLLPIWANIAHMSTINNLEIRVKDKHHFIIQCQSQKAEVNHESSY